MSQADLNIDNISRSLFRAEVNQSLQALASNSSGATEPTTPYPYQFWADTTSGKLKQRNAANYAWIEKGDLAAVDWGFIRATAIGSTVQAFDANTVKKNVANTFTATQVPDNGTASISTTSTHTFDGTDQIREITLTNAITVTFGAPSGIVPKAMYKFMLKAGDTSARVFAWNAAFKFPNGTPPLTAGATTNGAHDIISFIGGAGNTLIYDGHLANVG